MGVVDGFSVRMRDKSVDAILDEGAVGLQYWIQLVPRYNRAFNGDRGYPVGTLELMYDQQRGMNLAKLSSAADNLNAMLGTADQEGAVQERLAGQLPSLWQGAAADSGIGMLTQQNTLAAEDRRKVRAAMDAIRASITPFRDAVIAKAEFTLGLLEGNTEPKVDGKSPADIDNIISGAQAGAMAGAILGDDTLAAKLTKIFPELGGDGLDAILNLQNLWVASDSDYVEKVRDRCQRWLNEVFKKNYEDKQTAYRTVCETAHTAFESTYNTLEAALKQIDDDPYPAPAGEKKNDTPGTPGTPNTPGTPSTPSTPSGSTPSSTGTTSTKTSTSSATPSTPTTNVPSTTQTTTPSTQNSLQGLASLSQVAGSLGSAATTLGSAASAAAQSIGSGLGSLGTTIKDGIDNALEKVQQAQQSSKPLAEFDLAGKHLALKLGADGQPELVTTDTDGTTYEYSVRLDENGRPIVVDNVTSGAGTNEHTGTGQGTGESGAKPEGDGKPAGGAESEKGGTPEQNGSRPGHGAGESAGSGGDQGAKNEPGPNRSGEQSAPGGQSSGSAPSGDGTGTPGATPSVPPGRKGEDGEHTPKVPSPEHAPENSDSGAQLAEAGPL